MSATIPEVNLLLSDGAVEQRCQMKASPFTIGRLPDRDMVLTHPYVSREHAQLIHEADGFYVVDSGSRHGTFVNGQRITRAKIASGDNIRFGSLNGPLLQFDIHDDTSSSIRELLQSAAEPKSDIEKLSWFLEAARRLNTNDAVDQILASLVETTLQLTQLERGYVFLRNAEGAYKLAVGRTSTGEVVTDDSTLSHSAIAQAANTAGEFIVTDTLSAESDQRSESIVAQSIRTIICIPLRTRRGTTGVSGDGGDVLGVLYLDDRLKAGTLTQVDTDLLQTIATEAAALVENANLVREEEEARRYREELNIAAGIQQGLMAVQIPRLAYASVTARSMPCKEIGGDFFDVVATDDALSVVVADVSGKGVSAALLASTLQGLVYSQLLSGQSLAGIAQVCNRYICAKDISKYATMVILRLSRRGTLEYINCGHVMPLLVRKGEVEQLKQSNLPVGLIADADYDAAMLSLIADDRVLLVTDGVTEAEDPDGEFYGDARLQSAAATSKTLEDIFESVQQYCNGAPATDDCTMMEVSYTRA
jgi:serine phosphatase RsbU (regulator of sigma subunit)/pSer/pThr/pTyr-binding forkhead associated (FHA) protein